MNSKHNLLQTIAFCLALVLLFTACKKSETPAHTVYSATYGTVTIGGTQLKTIVIGHQTWTTNSFSGEENGMAHQINALKVVTTDGWRVPTIADFNTLTSNVSTKKDANGNYVAGPEDDLARLLRYNINYSPSFFFNGDLDGYEVFYGNVHRYDLNVAGYYMTADRTPDGYIHDAYLYKLSNDFAGIVYIKRDSAICASLRFVKDN
ncbi:hypothetical protein [Mucilaginibacter sp.]|uniref:hypothetical protein n=1 Tax=Mucilaginibacter sp. TaxID=1882438 RepID=UPI003267045A